jgi:hypothetical protein
MIGTFPDILAFLNNDSLTLRKDATGSNFLRSTIHFYGKAHFISPSNLTVLDFLAGRRLAPVVTTANYVPGCCA